MRQVTFKMVAAGDGSPPTSTGYCYYLVAHAVATVLLLITLVAAIWQFMDWVVTPSCPEASPVSSSAVAVAAGTTAPLTDKPTPTTASVSYRNTARTDTLADSGDCPCPKAGQ
ncbi:hypothetical protein AWC05_03010 [Mycobacterium florentinum]|uniref:Uncharacterized protein n=1 Tax=Mycobacterium florentinum TaxID=292462 RepID=A0A1X1TX39_MYCFL|nr:hypothetical protein [Mycobacterium florentinum]MCV7413435.1 hypothetical protein [Mycobacterium florentinum]ORV49146.1 hypothetical protein AWC05_03010 [Mycobacterium florentinum]BBX76968.1 hypothetical protein MFLOJ_07550 [Mycobacterium florentinum]